MKHKRLLKGVMALSLLGMLSVGIASCQPVDPPVVEKEAHNVKVSEIIGAKVSVDKTSAKEGETVIITISEIVEGKKFEAISVTGDGTITLKTIEEGSKYSFVMPNQEVTITVTLGDYEAHAISVNEVEGFEVAIYKDDTLVTSAVYNDELEVRITSTSEDKRFVSLTSEDVELNSTTDPMVFTFKMPDKAVALALTVEDIPTHTLSAKLGEGATGKFFVDGKEVNEAKEGENVVFSLSIDEAFSFKSITWTGIDLETEFQSSYEFTMGTSDVSVEVLTEAIPSYAIEINNPTGGKVTATIDGKEVNSARTGQTITLKLSFDAHYVFTSLTVNGGEVDLETVSEGLEYTFVMPSEAVTIDFAVDYIEQEFAVKSIEIIEPNVEITSEFSVGQKILEGEEVTLTISYDEYDFAGFELILNDEVIAFSQTDDYGHEFEAKFTMPSKDIDVVIAPLMETNENGVLFESINFNSELVSVYGIKSGERYDMSNYDYIYFYIVPKQGVRINSVEYFLNDQTRSNKISKDYDGTPNKYSFYSYNALSSDDKIRIEIDAKYVGIKSINFINDEHVTINGLQEGGYTPGNEYNFDITPDEGWYYVDCEVETETGGYVSVSTYSHDISFTMPEENVIITLNVAQTKKINVDENEFIESYEISDSYSYGDPISELAPGQTAYISATPKEGYEITNVFYQDGKACEEHWSDGVRYFEYPEEGDILITFEVTQRRKVTISESEAFYAEGLNGDYVPGETVEFELYNNLGYKITKVSLDNGTEISADKYDSNGYSFVMPDKDVEIIVETKEVATHVLTFEAPNGIGSINVYDEYTGNRVYSGDDVNAGSELRISLSNPNTGFTLDSIGLVTQSGETTLEEGVGGEYFFTMPEEDAQIVVHVTESPKRLVSLDTEDERVSMSLRNGAQYGDISSDNNGYVGMEVYVTVELDDPTDDYYLDGAGFSVKTASGKDVELENNIDVSKGSYITINFIMPDEEVIITPSVAQYPKFAPTLTENAKKYLIFKDNGFLGNEIDITQGLKAGTTILAYLNGSDEIDIENFDYVLRISLDSDSSELVRDEYTYTSNTGFASYQVPGEAYTVDLLITPKAE